MEKFLLSASNFLSKSMNRNRLLIIGLVIIGVVYWLYRQGSSVPPDNNSQNNNNNPQNNTNPSGKDENPATGWVRDTGKFSNTDIFTQLDPDAPGNRLPAAVSLRQFSPTPQNQGEQGSCTGWASGYAARTILEAVAGGVDPNQHAYSPAYTFNQDHGKGCNGAIMFDVLTRLTQEGTLLMSDFPYNERDCSRQPTAQQRQQAKNHVIKGFNRLTQGQTFDINLTAMKQNLAKGAPVLIGMPVGGNMMSLMGGENQGLWQPGNREYNALEGFRSGDYENSGLGGHAMCVMGYDDNKFGGAVEIQNSWGRQFGDDGFFWMKYKDFQNFCMEAYGLHPLVSKKADLNQSFQAALGLIINKTRQPIPFATGQGNIFQTQNVVPAGTRFKVEITNSIPCYAYVIGQETDGSSYILFPYTRKFSPYFGITGTRTFPEKQSLMLDNVGTQDVIAIILSKNAIDINQIDQAMNQNKSVPYAQRLQQALGNTLINPADVKLTAGENINIQVGRTTKNTTAVVMQINKK
jgi:C1A family cysteine protease